MISELVDLHGKEYATIHEFSNEMLIGLRIASAHARRMAFVFNEKNEFIGLFAECVLFSNKKQKQEVHTIKVDQNFEIELNKILWD